MFEFYFYSNSYSNNFESYEKQVLNNTFYCIRFREDMRTSHYTIFSLFIT